MRWPVADPAIPVAVALGALTSATLYGVWPLWSSATDPLRGLVALLPTIAAWLYAILRHLHRSTAPLVALAPWAVLWTVLALCRHAWLAEGGDEVFAAGFFLLLGLAFWRVARCLRPLLGQRLGERPSPLFFLLPLLAYCALLPWSLERPPDGDEPYYLLLTHSLAHDFDTDLTNNYQQGDARRFLERPLEPQMGDPRGANSEILSRHNALLPLVLAPFYRVGGRLGAAWAMALITATLAWYWWRLARFWLADRPNEAFLAWLLFAFGPPLLFYSHQIWIEVPAALLWVIAWERCLALTSSSNAAEGAPGDPPSAGIFSPQLLALAAPLALLPLLKFRLVLAAIPLALLTLYRLRRGKRGRFLPAVFFGGTVAALLAYNAFYFGNPLKMYGRGDFELLFSAPATHLRGFCGIFVDSAFGLFAAAPLWALLPLAALWILRHARPFAGQAAWLVLPYVLGFTPRLEWFGGWAPPFRYPMVFLPLLAIALAFGLRRSRPLPRAAFAALATATVLLTWLYLVVPGWTYNLADGSNHLLSLAGERLQADLTRFFPSLVRPRTATWVAVLVALVSAPLLAAGGPRGARGRRWAGPAGLLGLGLVVALLPWWARQWPTHRVELEDSWVTHRGGALFPDRWAISRPSFAGGWTLQPRDAAEARVVAGGQRVWIGIRVRNLNRRAELLRLEAGNQELTAWAVPAADDFQLRRLGPFPWQAGEVLRVVAAGQGALTVDYLELEWE